MSTYGFRVYGEGHLADTLRCELASQPGLRFNDKRGGPCLGFVAHDVTDHGSTDQLSAVASCFAEAEQEHECVVVLSQVPPGWTRRAARGLDAHVFYQADTIIVRRAVERMLRPEQFIVGCADPAAPLPLAYQEYLAQHACPVRQMSYESAELAKCAINYMLAQQISAANELAAAAREVGADYADVRNAMAGDARIGPLAYLQPGQPNQHLSRDVDTVKSITRSGRK